MFNLQDVLNYFSDVERTAEAKRDKRDKANRKRMEWTLKTYCPQFYKTFIKNKQPFELYACGTKDQFLSADVTIIGNKQIHINYTYDPKYEKIEFMALCLKTDSRFFGGVEGSNNKTENDQILAEIVKRILKEDELMEGIF